MATIEEKKYLDETGLEQVWEKIKTKINEIDRINATALANLTEIEDAADGFYLNVDDGKVYEVVDGTAAEVDKKIDTCEIEYELYNLNKEDLDVLDILFVITNAPDNAKEESPDRWVFISDSYEDFSHWITGAANKLGISSEYYDNIAKSGTAFNDGSWLQLLTDYRESITDKKANEVKYIVIAGGINDSLYNDKDNPGEYGEYYTKLYKSIGSFHKYVLENFPNAKIYYNYVGMAWEDSSVLYNRGYKSRIYAYGYITQCMADYPLFVVGKNTQFCLHNSDYIGSDRLHPNQSGGTVIARAVKDAILTGSTVISYSTRTLGITPPAGTDWTLTGFQGWTERLHNDKIIINAGNATIQKNSGSSITLSSSATGFLIGTLDSKYFQRFPNITCFVQWRPASGENTMSQGVLYCENRKLYLRLFDLNKTSWAYNTITDPTIINLIVPSFTIDTMEA